MTKDEIVEKVAIAIGRHFRDPKAPANDTALVALFEGAAKAAIEAVSQTIQDALPAREADKA